MQRADVHDLVARRACPVRRDVQLLGICEPVLVSRIVHSDKTRILFTNV